MLYLILIGIAIFFLVLWKDKSVMRIDFNILKNFMALMVLLTFFRLFLFSVVNEFGFRITDINQGIGQIEFWRFGLVFWEDAFFALPIYYMIDKWKWSQYIYLPIIAVLSICFGLGHMYQFEAAYFATLIIPYGVFYKFGKRYGFGTTMICHILFDMITFLTFKMSPFLI